MSHPKPDRPKPDRPKPDRPKPDRPKPDRPKPGRPNALSPETIAAQALHEIDPLTGAVAPPIHSTSTFARGEDYELIGAHMYSRYGNPTGDLAERVIAELEGGAASLLFGSGLAGIAAVFELVPAGRHVAVPEIMYFGAQSWIKRICERRNIGLTLFDQTDLESLRAAVQPGKTHLVWLETPANPTWDIVDIAAASEIARAAGALTGVDGTGAPPCTTRALMLGADIVFHSATKYLNGHSDMTGGVLTLWQRDELYDELELIRRNSGGVLGAFEAWLLLRGMRTLFVRFRRQSETAMTLARHLELHPKVQRVLYPGLESHANHHIARAQMTGGFGGMLSIVTSGSWEDARRACGATRVFVPATSLGGVESLIEHRKTVEGPSSPVADTLIRISVGLEAPEDLIADLDQALAVI